MKWNCIHTTCDRGYATYFHFSELLFKVCEIKTSISAQIEILNVGECNFLNAYCHYCIIMTSQCHVHICIEHEFDIALSNFH